MLHRLLWLTAALSFALISLGGFVHNTESSLACPDWPLCFGRILPEMRGGVAIEHSHRLLATLVGMLTIAVLVLCHRARPRDPSQLRWAWAALALVLVQGLLGGLTVLLRLPTLVSTAHLATSMAYYCTLLVLAFRATPRLAAQRCANDPALRRPLRWLLVAGALVYLQMLLGALVRHTGSGAAVGLGPESIAIGFDLASGEKSLWPQDGPGRLHIAHRAFAPVVLALLLAACHFAFHAARARGDRSAAALAAAAVAVCLLQIGLGVAAIWTYLGVAWVTAHLAGAALLLSLLLFLRMRLARVPVSVAAPMRG
jgi:heme A synthase